MHPFFCRAALRILRALPLPERHLYNTDGNVYMYRWNVVGEFALNKDGKDIIGTRALGSRLLEAVTFGRFRAIRLHNIVNADRDRDLHNHPFDYDSLILDGWYFEQLHSDDPHGKFPFRMRTQGNWNRGRANTFHRIASVRKNGGVWSLFFMTANSNDWGFMVDGVFVKSNLYFLQRRREAKGMKG